ncbi:MAG: hypothetical protein BVN35_22030 [Proteobacteria bacterium ST_bin11]|nr:MAG: hypothetical protein BVN35_22030 [Proteobacteria bacterium ST_bin11]
MDRIELIFSLCLAVLLLLGVAPMYFAHTLDYNHHGEACVVVNKPLSEEDRTLFLGDTMEFQHFYTSIEDALEDCPTEPVNILLVEQEYAIEEPRRLAFSRDLPLYITSTRDDKSTRVLGFSEMFVNSSKVDIHFDGWHAVGSGGRSLFKTVQKSKECGFVGRHMQCTTKKHEHSCLLGGRVDFNNMKFSDYTGDAILCQEGKGTMTLARSKFLDVKNKAVALRDPSIYSISGNQFCSTENTMHLHQNSKSFLLIEYVDEDIKIFNAEDFSTLKNNAVKC